MFICNYLVDVGVCVCHFVQVVGVYVFVPQLVVRTSWDEVCAGMSVCVRANSCTPARPPSSQLPGQRSVGGH